MLQGSVAGNSDSGGTCRAVGGLVPGHAGVRAALSAPLQHKGGGRAPARPPTVPLDSARSPGCQRGPMPSALAGADRWTHGAGKGLAGAGNS